jgi:hypothetical protein
MNQAANLLSELNTRGVIVTSAGTCLYLSPSSAVSPDLVARVRALKPELLELLRAGAMASPAEWRILTTLARHPGIALDQLATATRLAQPPLAEALQTLLRRAEIAPGPAGRLYLRTV